LILSEHKDSQKESNGLTNKETEEPALLSTDDFPSNTLALKKSNHEINNLL
jgi:hypothetical protein